MRNLDEQVTRMDDKIEVSIINKTLHVNKAMHNQPNQMIFMVKWAYEHPFGKIGGDESGPITRQRAQDIDFGESEIMMTDTEVEDVQSPSSTVTQYQFQKLAPLQNDSLQKALQSDTIMMDAPSVYDEQLATMIRQVQGASAYLYKLSGEDRDNARNQYNELLNITKKLHHDFSEEKANNRHMTATVYEEFHKGSINFAKMVYEKLAEQETNLEISKK